jgi:hypothetical protein
MWDCDMQPSPIFSLWRFQSGEKLFQSDPNVWRVGSEILDGENTEESEIG